MCYLTKIKSYTHSYDSSRTLIGLMYHHPMIPACPCLLRPWLPADLDSLVRYANNYNIWINLRDRLPHPYTVSDGRVWIEYANATRPITNLAIAYQGEAIGSIGLTLQDDIESGTAEVGYWLAEPFWGRGWATTALRSFCRWAFHEFALRRLYAGVMAENQPSRRVLEKVGFVLEGIHRQHVCKAGVVHDQAYYGLLQHEFQP